MQKKNEMEHGINKYDRLRVIKEREAARAAERARLRKIAKQKGVIGSELAVMLACVLPFLYLGAKLAQMAGWID